MGVSGQRNASAALYPRYSLDRRLGGPQSRSEHRGYTKNPLTLLGIEPRSSCPYSHTILLSRIHHRNSDTRQEMTGQPDCIFIHGLSKRKPCNGHWCNSIYFNETGPITVLHSLFLQVASIYSNIMVSTDLLSQFCWETCRLYTD
jgi:hypothetical protein